jgi:hypothetical protein
MRWRRELSGCQPWKVVLSEAKRNRTVACRASCRQHNLRLLNISMAAFPGNKPISLSFSIPVSPDIS